jgi:hypothetical protein
MYQPQGFEERSTGSGFPTDVRTRRLYSRPTVGVKRGISDDFREILQHDHDILLRAGSKFPC